MPQHNSTPIGLSVADAAELTSFSEWVIRAGVNSGEIPAIRKGRRIAVDYAGLMAWFKAQQPVVESA